MQRGNFSNNGENTFSEDKQNYSCRLQQGVPLLDRDWNEAEDIRAYFQRMLRRNYIGEGAPDMDGFKVRAPAFPADNDFEIVAGRYMADGLDLRNANNLLYSEQTGVPALTTPAAEEVLEVYLLPEVVRITAENDPDLQNAQDINLETCVRDRLQWRVGVARAPEQPPAGSVPLARIQRAAGRADITEQMIVDRRRTNLNLAATLDSHNELSRQVEKIEQRVEAIEKDVATIKTDLARLFWDVSLAVTKTNPLFGEKISITATVVDGLNNPISGARVEFSSSWGSVTPGAAVTNAQGKATVSFIGVETATPILPSDMGILARAAERVYQAMLPNPGSIEYAKVRFEPQELALVSRYSPTTEISNLSHMLPTGPIVAVPPARTVTVSANATEFGGGVVRGVGSRQISLGIWVRDWARTKIFDAASRARVGVRVGERMRAGVVDGAFRPERVVGELPRLYRDVDRDATDQVKLAVFDNPNAQDQDLARSGGLVQAINEEVVANVGKQANSAVMFQLQSFVDDDDIDFGAEQVEDASLAIIGGSNQILAGQAQSKRILFNSGGF